MNINYPVTLPAIKVEQPLGIFYAVCIDATLLLSVAYSIPATAVNSEDRNLGYSISGSQRDTTTTRLKEIGSYIDTVEASFPNAIILGANVKENGVFEDDESKIWRVEKSQHADCYHLIIPSSTKLASIIDGQHRLLAFEYSARKDMPLLCAVYLDLPMPYHAFIFSTINFNQKKVDKSLAYNLFGFNLENEPPDVWAPETFAVYIARILGSKEPSPFYKKISIGIQDSDQEFTGDSWSVSMATVVDGILKLITSNPKRDRDIMGRKAIIDGKSRRDLKEIKDNSPLRNIYINCNDRAIFEIVHHYFTEVETCLWKQATALSYINKTVGVQALFDVLQVILKNNKELSGIRGDITEKINLVRNFDFSDRFLDQASGKGRARIRNVLALLMQLVTIDSVRASDEDKIEYERILNNYSSQV